MSRKRIRVAIVIATMLAPVHGMAAPAESRAVAVSPLTIRGELPRQSAQRLEQRLLDGMAEAGFDVVDDGSTLLRATVAVEQRDYTLTAELVDGTRVLVRAEEECDLCGVEEAGDRLAGLAVSIRRELDAEARAQPMLHVISTPAGATVIVDGEVAGISPVELALPPGLHEVRLVKDGFVAREREVELVRGVDASIVVELSPAPLPLVDASVSDRRIAPAWVGWTVLGAGALSAIAGVTLLALHGRPIRSKCTGANVDMDGTCRFSHDTLVPGAIIGAAGLTLLSTGIALVVTRHKRAGASSKTAFRPSPGGVAVRF